MKPFKVLYIFYSPKGDASFYGILTNGNGLKFLSLFEWPFKEIEKNTIKQIETKNFWRFL